jgi:universal stress protein A
MSYREILLALDLGEQSESIARRCLALAQGWGATVRLLHVVPFMPVEPMNESLVPAVQLDMALVEKAKGQLLGLAASLGVPAGRCNVITGSVKAEILRAARDQQCDLVVLGARERHGLSILVNRTEDTVLHGASCDVLVLRTR